MSKIPKHILYLLTITGIQFFLFHKLSILDPLNHGWFFHSGDLSSMLISQIYFLQQDNFFAIPLGNVYNYAGIWCGNLIKFEVPVILFTKVVYTSLNYLGFNLPLDIQFFGLFNLINMFLLNYFLFKILMISNKKLSSLTLLLSVLLLSSSPYILFRNLIFHFNLASYWIVAACIYYAIQPVYKFWPWMWLSFFAGVIHPYLIPFPIVMWSIVTIDMLRIRNFSLRVWIEGVGEFTILMLALIIPILLISGIWLKSGQLSASGLGSHHSNLLSIFDSNGYSTFLKNIPTLHEKNGDYEGFGYVGLGSILIFSVALLFLFRGSNGSLQIGSRYWRLLIGAIFFFLLSTGGVIAIGNQGLVSVQFNEYIFRAYSIFRSSGRFIVFSILVLQIVALLVIYRNMNGKRLIAFLFAALMLQLYDEKPLIDELRLRDGSVVNAAGSNILSQINWNKVNSLDFVVPENSHYEWKMSLIYEAAMRGIPTNDGFCARSNDKRLYELRGDLERKIISQKDFKSQTLYAIYPDKEYINPPSKEWIKIPFLGGASLIGLEAIFN